MTEAYIVLDLEMCQIPRGWRKKDFPYRNEIIQIGAVMLDSEFEIIDQFDSFVKPMYGSISHFINELTGIHEGMVKTAPYLEEVLGKLLTWIGDTKVKFVAWSNSDKAQLCREIKCKKVDLPYLELFTDCEHWIDYQQVFSDRFDMNRQVSLSEALEITEVDVSGRLHDGLDDAMNTAKLVAKLEKDPDFRPIMERMGARRTDHNMLAFSMSELFSPELMAQLSCH